MATSPEVTQVSLRQVFGIVTLIGLTLVPAAYGAYGATFILVLFLSMALLLWNGRGIFALFVIGVLIVVGMAVWLSNRAIPAPRYIGSDSNDPFIQQIIKSRESAARKLPPP
ncbi:MAG: hypothetical protein U0795_18925 [Pirellulales bacterium]